MRARGGPSISVTTHLLPCCVCNAQSAIVHQQHCSDAASMAAAAACTPRMRSAPHHHTQRDMQRASTGMQQAAFVSLRTPWQAVAAASVSRPHPTSCCASAHACFQPSAAVAAVTAAAAAAAAADSHCHTRHRFLAGSDSDSDSDEDRRVVLKSARDKRFSELSDTCDEIRVRLAEGGGQQLQQQQGVARVGCWQCRQ
jgi:hypothetical protein